jgi:hypothetical protein
LSQPFVNIIILNTNRKDDTLEALASIEKSDYPNYCIIVLDNASSDGSLQAIRSAYPQVQIIQLEDNLGYAGNNNVGIRAAIDMGADWVFVLNEDTVMAQDCLSRLVEVGESDPQIGIVGPMVYHHDEPNVIQSAGGRLGKGWQSMHLGQNMLDEGQYSQTHQVDWISGCAIMVRRQVIMQIGMLDSRFFYYYEETEWCMRAGKSGWSILQVPGAKLWHKGVQREYSPSPSVTYYATRNRFLMLLINRAPLSIWIAAWGQTIRTLMSWSINPKRRVMRDHRNAMVKGILDFFHKKWGMLSE